MFFAPTKIVESRFGAQRPLGSSVHLRPATGQRAHHAAVTYFEVYMRRNCVLKRPPHFLQHNPMSTEYTSTTVASGPHE